MVGKEILSLFCILFIAVQFLKSANIAFIESIYEKTLLNIKIVLGWD